MMYFSNIGEVHPICLGFGEKDFCKHIYTPQLHSPLSGPSQGGTVINIEFT